ncbi:hypothetical protein [Actibacterium sp. D379-3]
MSDIITKYSIKLREALKNSENRLKSVSAKIVEGSGEAQAAARENLKALQDRAVKAQASLQTARKDVADWLDEPEEKVKKWVHERDVARLEARAKRADRYAEAAAEVAAASMESAEQAMLEAKLAHMDAEAAKETA